MCALLLGAVLSKVTNLLKVSNERWRRKKWFRKSDLDVDLIALNFHFLRKEQLLAGLVVIFFSNDFCCDS